MIGEGEATAPPAKIEEMYEPQRYGLSETRRFVIGGRGKAGEEAAEPVAAVGHETSRGAR